MLLGGAACAGASDVGADGLGRAGGDTQAGGDGRKRRGGGLGAEPGEAGGDQGSGDGVGALLSRRRAHV